MGTFVREAPVEDGVEEEIFKLVRRDVVAPRVVPSDGKAVADNINSLLQRASVSAVQEIDHLINALQISRERLHLEGERVEREVFDYVTLSQSALQATKLIADRLSQLNSVPDAPSIAYEEA